LTASQEQTLSGTGARVYTAHRGWLGVVTGISAASTGSVLVLVIPHKKKKSDCPDIATGAYMNHKMKEQQKLSPNTIFVIIK